MARKSARAVAAAEAANQSNDEGASSSKVPLSELSPKSCLTCGRVVTPRAKWAKDWNGIKYCSDSCRSTRPGKVVVRFSPDGDAGDLGSSAGVKREDAAELKVDVETFVEGILLEVARQNGGGTLEDVQDRIKDLLRSSSIEVGQPQHSPSKEESGSDTDHDEQHKAQSGSSNEGQHPLWKALDSPPGLRERIRRAARRLALGITHDSDAQQTNITTTDAGSIELSQNGKMLQTVQDLSFAKGVLHVKSKNKP
ncbi:uncharacterized protein SRS1_12830 [Sporisorium reilianum f. sp. reilianum]|uniref:Uncharacterized protein n=1 Tax=Sporisorium reilianum f. sp. reilianum TaxID=72559 RepID=A0A2N8U9X9_9BASI|nr:uncharacterized protein SRS1_12830 [Sporisorium reilianum f. sp. reilianum]